MMSSYIARAAEALSAFGHAMETECERNEFSDAKLARCARAYLMATTALIMLQMEMDGIDSSAHFQVTARLKVAGNEAN